MTPATSDHDSTVRDNTAKFLDIIIGDYDAVAKELVAQYEREEKLLGGIAKREASISKLSSDLSSEKKALKAAEARLAAAEQKLQRLENTKALRLQRAYWRATRPLRRPNAR